MKINNDDPIRARFYEEIGKIEPLSDEHFKEIFEDESRFKEIVELILGRGIGEEIINLNGELRLVVKGKSIRMDICTGTKARSSTWRHKMRRKISPSKGICFTGRSHTRTR